VGFYFISMILRADLMEIRRVESILSQLLSLSWLNNEIILSNNVIINRIVIDIMKLNNTK